MNAYNPKKHNRKSIRLKGYDYAQAGLYFVTLCVQNRKAIFGGIHEGKMHLNLLGRIAEQEWRNTAEIRKNCSLGPFIIMPNHFHAIISIDYTIKPSETIGEFKSPSQSLGAIIRGYKGATTKKIKSLYRTGESDSRMGRFNSRTGELQFAPTEEFAPTDKSALPAIDLSKSIWQRNYWDHIIRNEKAHYNIANYIINNPAKWEADKFKT